MFTMAKEQKLNEFSSHVSASPSPGQTPGVSYLHSMATSLGPATTNSLSTRRSTRPKRPLATALSTQDPERLSRQSKISHLLGRYTQKRRISASNPRPDELDFNTKMTYPQKVIIRWLRSKSFSIPPREINSSIPLFSVTTCDGTTVSLPRGYRVPLMFVAKLQWNILELVLTAPEPQAEWAKYRFDIVHLCRLCNRLFNQAKDAQNQATAAGGKGIDRSWRSATFDTALTRFYHHWFGSRECSIRMFREAFGNDEWEVDVLKYGRPSFCLSFSKYLQLINNSVDWVRWSLKGHKGFVLTKDQVSGGITAKEFMHGLSNYNGVWSWVSPCQLANSYVQRW